MYLSGFPLLRKKQYVLRERRHGSTREPGRVFLAWHAEVGKMTTFDLWPWGGGAWGAGANMWHPETPASYESVPDPLATQIPTLWILTSGGGWGGGAGFLALILDWCRAFDLFASVDAHLWHSSWRRCFVYIYCSNRSAPDWGKWCGPSGQAAWTVQITPCRITLLQPARRAAVLVQPSSFRHPHTYLFVVF